jgi:cell division protein FtsB
MDPGSMAQIATLVAAVGGGWVTGRRGVARQTVDLLQIQASTLETQNGKQGEKITALEAKVEVLESLVTQRAAVAEVKEVVDRIAARVGA